MAVKTFAAIDVGSYELSMKIFSFSAGTGIKDIDHLRHRIELGTETYTMGKLSVEKVDELCRVLSEFSEVMRSYKVSDYVAYGTSAIREMKNRKIILDQIEKRTGIRIEVLSNSEQRFLDCKSVAFKGDRFRKLVAKGTAVVDIGGGSIQISLFDKDTLITSQNLRLGILRLREELGTMYIKPSAYADIISESADSQLEPFEKLYLKDVRIENLIVIDEYISRALLTGRRKGADCYIEARQYLESMQDFLDAPASEHVRKMQMPKESLLLVHISAILVRNILRDTGAKHIWIPGVSLADGIAYEYAEKNRIIQPVHNFEKDILGCAQNISNRYMGSKTRGETLEAISVAIFDAMKKQHGLKKRERLLLRLAAFLHDCGKYITLMNVGEASYEIIMSTEIIGLSHNERMIVASVVRYTYGRFAYYDELAKTHSLDPASYLVIAKLAAILRLAAALDKSHREKFKNISASLRGSVLNLTVDTDDDITLEKGSFDDKASFFEEIFSITPVIKKMRSRK